MSTFFKPYEGKRPFVFVSYAHRQSEAVVSTLRILHEKGWRLWYDEGIPAGSDWPANIADHMEACERVIFFLSERALQSPNCYSEMKTAVQLGKPVLVVRLEDTAPSNLWEPILKNSREIPLLPDSQERAAAILGSGFLPRRFHRSRTENLPPGIPAFVLALLFFLGAAGTLFLLQSGRLVLFEKIPAPPEEVFEEETIAPAAPPVVEIGEAEKYFALSFPDTEQELAIRHALGVSQTEPVYRWQLSPVTSLFFCGNITVDSLDAISRAPDGTWQANSAPVITGQVSDLSLIGNCLWLEHLSLIAQPVSDLSPLSGLVLLEELDLSGSTVESVGELSNLPSLSTLHLEYSNLTDLTPFEALPNLKTVTVSRDMLPLTWSDQAGFSVVLVRE